MSQDRACLGDFTMTGWQDCNNAIEVSEFLEALRELALSDEETARASATSLAEMCVRRVTAEWSSAEWIASQDADTFDSLDPVACFEAWRNAWAQTAIGIMTAVITERRARLADNV